MESENKSNMTVSVRTMQLINRPADVTYRGYFEYTQMHCLDTPFDEAVDELSPLARTVLGHQLERAEQDFATLSEIRWSGSLQFLRGQQLYNWQTKRVATDKIKAAMRSGMAALLSANQLTDASFWWGALELLPDNLHVRIGLVSQRQATGNGTKHLSPDSLQIFQAQVQAALSK